MPRVRESTRRRRWRRLPIPALTAICARATPPSLPVNTALAQSSLFYGYKSFFWLTLCVCVRYTAPGTPAKSCLDLVESVLMPQRVTKARDPGNDAILRKHYGLFVYLFIFKRIYKIVKL